MSTQTFGNRLREIRERSGLSQQALAKRAKISSATVSRIELGQSSPTLDTVEALADALGLSLVGMLRDGMDRPDQLAALIRELPSREQNLAYALVGTMRVQLAVNDDQDGFDLADGSSNKSAM